MAASDSNWPGSWEPSLQDVDSAHELPAPAELSNFKKALFASSDAYGIQNLMKVKLDIREPEQQHTYPMALLYSFPQIPAKVELSRLRQEFQVQCEGHLFLAHLPAVAGLSETIVPHLGLAMACLTSVCERIQPSVGSRDDWTQNLYVAGISLWTVMLEVDNREARSLETVTAATLLLMYGSLHPATELWKQSSLMMGQCATIARRLRLQDTSQVDSRLLTVSPNPIRAYSSVVCLLWLDDILHALHLDLPRNFRTSEMWIKMPSSGHDFQDIYRAMIREEELPSDLRTPEDGMVLLTGILSDLMSVNRGLRPIVQHPPPKHGGNPYLALTPYTELNRMQNLLSNGLDKWRDHFEAILNIRQDVAAFYHYCRLYLSYPGIASFSRIAGYRFPNSDVSKLGEAAITDDATSSAWSVRESAAARAKHDNTLCAVWLPVIVFQAALVIAARLSSTTEENAMYNNPLALTAFKVELENMPWPCCEQMVNTLERLMAQSHGVE